MADPLRISVNGVTHEVVATPDTPLLYVLRNELGLNSPKFGCGLAQCGSCTVHLGGKPIRSCIVPVSAAAQAPVTTLEGLGGGNGLLHPLQQAFLDEQAGQCAYCISGIIMSAAALLAENASPSDDEIKTALAAERLGAHADQLSVQNGTVSVRSDPSRTVGYGDLIGNRRFSRAVSNQVATKKPDAYTIVGTSVPRLDPPGKLTGAVRSASGASWLPTTPA